VLWVLQSDVSERRLYCDWLFWHPANPVARL